MNATGRTKIMHSFSSKTKESLFESSIASPLGRIHLAATDSGLVFCVFAGNYQQTKERYRKRGFTFVKGTKHRTTSAAQRHLAQASSAIHAYFKKKTKQVHAVATKQHGTRFQCQVWAALRRIPAGRTLTYGTLAARIKKPKACRAVAAACKANPLAIIVPCHRAVAANGLLGGYNAGVQKKLWLLQHE